MLILFLQDADGITPLSLICRMSDENNQNLDCLLAVKKLLELGANPDLEDKVRDSIDSPTCLSFSSIDSPV